MLGSISRNFGSPIVILWKESGKLKSSETLHYFELIHRIIAVI